MTPRAVFASLDVNARSRDDGARASIGGEWDFDDVTFEADDARAAKTTAKTRTEADVGFDVCSVLIRCARVMCAPRGERARMALRALRRAATELGAEAFKDDSRRARVRENGLDTLAETLVRNEPKIFARLERASSETPKSGDVADALTKLSHSYLWLPPVAVARAVGGEYASVDDRIIIEPNLRSHFVVGRATPQYARLVEAIPHCFVGSYAQLTEIVNFMSTHMSASFRESGLDVPPWRRPSALTSKWTIRSDMGSSAPPSPSSSPSGPLDFGLVGFDIPKPAQGRRRVLVA